jgi:hypothetical protein
VATKDCLNSRFNLKWFLGDKGNVRLDGIFVKNYTKRWLEAEDEIEVIFDRTTGKLGFKINGDDKGIACTIEDFEKFEIYPIVKINDTIESVEIIP